MNRKDSIGQELQIGDEVIIIRPYYRGLIIGKLVGFTPQKFKVEFVRHAGYHPEIKALDECIKLNRK